MKKNVYCVKDSKSEYGSVLLVCENDDVACRDFSMAVQQPGSLMFSHPEDFFLEKVSEFDTKTGLMTSFESPIPVARALDFRKVGDSYEQSC